MSFIPGTKPLPNDIAPKWTIKELVASRIKWFKHMDDLANYPYRPLPYNKAADGKILIPERFLERKFLTNWRGYKLHELGTPTAGGWLPFDLGKIFVRSIHGYAPQKIFTLVTIATTLYMGRKLWVWEYSDPMNMMQTKSIPYMEASGQLTLGNFVTGFPTDLATDATIHKWVHGKVHDETIKLTRNPMPYD